MTRIHVDIETYSSVDLNKYGVYRYTESPDFLILMAGWSVEGGPVYVETDEEENRRRIKGYLAFGATLVAHNAQFERICFSRLLGMPVGEYLDPAQWHDTQAIAAEHGYPMKLEHLARALGCEQKDTAGTRLINFFCKPDRNGKRRLPEDHPDEWLEFVAYCHQDVVTLIDVDRILGGWPTQEEHLIYLADQRINDAGIRIDVELAEYAAAAAEDNRMEQELRVMALTGVANPGSQPQFLAWCQQAISPNIKNLQAATIERLLASPKLAPVQREVLELRQELALVASKKFASALMSVSTDDRLRGTLKFYKAHTGRWAGKGTQVHNLPREAFDDLEQQAAAMLDLKCGWGASSLDLKRLVRPMFWGPFTVVDYAAIEARVIAWLAGEEWALRAFRAGRDIYVETAHRMSTADHPLSRSQGKVAVLALGYNGGPNSLRAMGAEGTEDDLQLLVTQWRKANPRIVRLWRLMSDAIADEGQVGAHMRITRDEETVRLHLPSGRAITYHGMRWERYRVLNARTNRPEIKEGWRYDNPERPGQRIGTYGGRMVENATQAVARDLMAMALVRLQRAGYTVVGHVHDEIIVEGAHPVDKIASIMCKTPRWATDLPVDGEGFITERYAKG